MLSLSLFIFISLWRSAGQYLVFGIQFSETLCVRLRDKSYWSHMSYRTYAADETHKSPALSIGELNTEYRILNTEY